MFSWQWVWGLLLSRAFLAYPLSDLGVDFAKLFFMKSPNTRITWYLMPWTIQFTFFVVVCLNGILAPSFLPHQTSPIVVALPSYQIVVKSWVVCSICVVVCCFVVFYCCVVDCVTLVVRSWIMMYVIFAALIIRPWVLLYNQLGFLPTQYGSFPMLWFSIKFLLFSQKKKIAFL